MAEGESEGVFDAEGVRGTLEAPVVAEQIPAAVVPVIEEELRAGKREVGTGGVRNRRRHGGTA